MEETGVAGRATGSGSAGGNPLILIGSSMGAIIAQIAAAKQPKRVRAIILLDGCHPMSGKTDSGLLLMALSSVGRRWYRNFRKNHEGAWRSLYGYYRDLDAMSEEDKTFLRNRVIDRVESLSQEEAYFLSLHSVIAFNMRGEKKFSRAMKGFTGKILVLWGESDRVMPFEKTSRFQSLHPDADFQFIKGAGHLPHQEAPRETAGAIVKWIGA
jgi:pimeloyl-ACP methyl ester carboxylesterase